MKIMAENNNSNVTYFGETNFRNEKKKFGIKKRDRARHMYIIGKTGTGKTTLLENMAIQDILNGEGVGIVDPHGEFAEKMLKFVPKNRVQDVLYFAPHDMDYRFPSMLWRRLIQPKGIWCPVEFLVCLRKFGRMFGRREWNTF